MNLGFWEKLKKPIMVLAPMADVTDAAFRSIIAKYGKPDVTWTEFVSADGLCHPKGCEKLLIDLKFSEAERPIVAQLFTSNPDNMRKAAALVRELGFDGLDINMGCPDKTVEKQGCGAALIKNPKLARELIRAAKEGAGSLPVSVKTRIGYNENELNTWLPELLAEEPAVVTIHARTRKEMSNVPARWEHVKEAVEIRDKLGSKTLIFGNGDVLDLADAQVKVSATGADGAMLGRAIFGNPFLFAKREAESRVGNQESRIQARLEVMLEHTKLFEKFFKGIKSFAVMKKHYKAYVLGFASQGGPGHPKDDAKELRMKLMETQNAEEVEVLVRRYLNSRM